VLEDQLRPGGYTLRHFPQSFEFSTLGGWLATRSGGHYATNYTHIDDFAESLRVVTPAGISESRRLPGSGAGPSPDRLFLGRDGSAPDGIRGSSGEGASGSWRNSFVRAPYGRAALFATSVIADTFETSIPWSGFADLHARTMSAVTKALKDVCGGGSLT